MPRMLFIPDMCSAGPAALRSVKGRQQAKVWMKVAYLTTCTGTGMYEDVGPEPFRAVN